MLGLRGFKVSDEEVDNSIQRYKLEEEEGRRRNNVQSKTVNGSR